MSLIRMPAIFLAYDNLKITLYSHAQFNHCIDNCVLYINKLNRSQYNNTI